MKATSIKLNNVLGFEEFEIALGGLTKVTGRNGSGKTSLLRGILGAITKGTDATLVRNGAEEAEIVMVLDDKTTITKRIPRDGGKASVKVKFADHGKGDQTWINSIQDALSTNPIEFLTASKKDRVQIFLETVPLNVVPEELAKACGDAAKGLFDVYELPKIPSRDKHNEGQPIDATLVASGLDLIELVRKYYYDERTVENRAAKEKEAHVQEMLKAMPPEIAPVEVAPLREKLEAVRARIADKRLSTQQILADGEKETRGKFSEWEKNELAELEKQIQKLREDCAAKIKAKSDEVNAGIKENAEVAVDKLQEFEQQQNTEIETLTAQITEAEFQEKEFERGRDARVTIENYETAINAAKKKSAAYTEAIAGIDGYKEKVLAALPIPGLTVTNGELYYEGVIWEDVNTAKQIKVAIELAKLRAGELGIVCVDGLEAMDSNSFAEFEKQALASGLQFIVAEVADMDLKIETTN